MNTLPIGQRKPGLTGDIRQYSISNPHTDNPRIDNSVHGHSNQNIGNVSNSYNNTINVGVNEESLRIQAWLSPLEPHRRHQDVSSRRLDGVGSWVLQRNEFESWRKIRDGSVNPTLRCYGGQGVGKTYISSLVIDTLYEQAQGHNIAVLFLYCDYQAQEDQSAVNMVGGLLRQVVLGETETPSEIQSAFKGLGQRGSKSLRLPDMLELFIKVISSIERVYICVDAVDELLPQDRSELLRALQQIIHESPNTRLFLTGRPYIRRELDKYLMEGAYTINVVADQGDIARYISQRMVNEDTRDPDLMTENLKNDIMRTILEKASEMFLLVVLDMEAILGETSLAKRKKMLQKVAATGVDLDSVYDQSLQRIKEQKGDWSRLGMEVLMWISHAERPLRIDELCHALAVEMEATDLDPENIRPQDTVLRSCLGLAAVEKETSTIRLIHYTLQEYLSRPSILPDAHKTLGQTCLTYLNYDRVKGLPTTKVWGLSDMPFLEYSSLYWGSHAKKELSNPGKSLALQLLNQYENHISAIILFKQIHRYDSSLVTHNAFTGLHCASYFGVVEVVAALIDMKGCDINKRDGYGFTPLMWASWKGHKGVMRLLLSRGDINPDKPNNAGRTPLCCASEFGHEEVVRLLLVRDDVNPDSSDNYGRTPLWWASRNGHEGVMRLLLTSGDVNPDKPDHNCRTPLSAASRSGHEGVVRILLTCDNVNPDKPDNYGETPLLHASLNGHEGVVRLLVARDDVNPDKPDSDGQTPLWRACFHGHEGVVRLLLTQDNVNSGNPDKDGRTPLLHASFNGYDGVVKLLLARDDLDPDTPDNNGRTPLWWASWNGHEGVAKLLLTRSKVSPDRPDNDGQTPLCCASEYGHEGVVRLLLTRSEVNPDKLDNHGRTPLWCASWKGHEGVVGLLLTRDDVDPGKPDNNGQTPLHCASEYGYKGVVSLLLTQSKVNPEKPDSYGQTPLWIAGMRGHWRVVALLQPQTTTLSDPD